MIPPDPPLIGDKKGKKYMFFFLFATLVLEAVFFKETASNAGFSIRRAAAGGVSGPETMFLGERSF
jgi:hypothetical protein